MAIITNAKIFDEVAKKRGRLLNDVGNFPTTADEYQEVWDCMNRYISSCVDHKKGISITNFCKFGYSQDKSAKGKWRPYFTLAESFCKNYAVDMKSRTGPPLPGTEQLPLEEFNFSKAAIKYSNHLQKDNVFSGMRYIIQAIGEALSLGKKLEIDFEHGKFCAEERRTKFIFRADVFAREGLSVPTETVKNPAHYKPSATFQPPSAEALKLRLQGTKVRKANLELVPEARQAYEKVREDVLASSPMSHQPLESVTEEWRHSQPSLNTDVLEMPPPRRPPPAMASPQGADSESDMSVVSEVSIYDPAKYKGPNPKQEMAQREAMDRYLTEMEIRASEAIADRRQWEEHLERCLKQERDDLERKRTLAEENSQFIQQQMEWNRVKRGHDRKNWIQGASAHEFPRFTEPDDAGLRALLKDRAQQMRNDLDLQVRTNNSLKTVERNRERELEYNQLVANKNEVITQTRNEADAKAFEKKTLTDSWSREVRMKHIWKAIENHTQAAHSAVGKSQAQLLDMNDDVSDTMSCTSSTRGFSTRNRKPPMGASVNLDRQKVQLGRK